LRSHPQAAAAFSSELVAESAQPTFLVSSQ
jgi:hypothetical protein